MHSFSQVPIIFQHAAPLRQVGNPYHGADRQPHSCLDYHEETAQILNDKLLILDA